MKKSLLLVTVLVIAMVITSCGGSKDTISVVSREDGSGTRSAFVELTGVEEKGADGSKTDKTTTEAITANKTDIMLTNIANDKNAIGYVSLGSVNDSIKAISVDGVAPTSANVASKSYKIARPFMIATKGEKKPLTEDFIKFILSKEGQEIVAGSYIKAVENAESYTASGLEGKLVIAGSSSVTPVMEKLKEAYVKLNPSANVEVQQSDSSTGLKDAIAGSADIGMASRDLKESELKELSAVEIAIDGIAVIVNKENDITDLKMEDIKKIFTGETTSWGDLSK